MLGLGEHFIFEMFCFRKLKIIYRKMKKKNIQLLEYYTSISKNHTNVFPNLRQTWIYRWFVRIDKFCRDIRASSSFIDRNLSTQNIPVLRKDGGNVCINKNIKQNIIAMCYVKLKIPLLSKIFIVITVWLSSSLLWLLIIFLLSFNMQICNEICTVNWTLMFITIRINRILTE